MFLSLFLSHAASVPVNFDPWEMRHTRNDFCVDLTFTNKVLKVTKNMMNSQTIRECNNIGAVELENGITTIKNYMFYGSSITSISGTTSLTSIGEGAFAYCTNLVKFDFGNVLTTINKGAFCHSGLGGGSDTVNIGGNDLKEIGEYAFTGCPLDRTVVTIQASDAATINNYAFYKTGIRQLTIPKLNNIGDYAFSECPSLSQISNSITVDTIGNYAFYNTPITATINTLTSVSIGEEAFSTTQLTFGTILQKVTTTQNPAKTTRSSISISAHAFSGRTITGHLNFPSPDEVDEYGNPKWNFIGAFAFSKCKFRTANQNLEFHMTTIGNYAFSECDFIDLRRLALLDSSTLGQHAFEMTKGNLEIQTSDNGNDKNNHYDRNKCHLTTIPNYAFYSSTALKSSNNELYITGSIGIKAFSNCTNLAGSLFINTNQIGSYAFANCHKIAGTININFYTPSNNQPNIGQGSFEFCNSTITQLKITADYDEIGDSPSIQIGRRAFYGSGLACELVIHSYVTDIHEYAFANCLQLKNNRITIYANTIHSFAFADCGSLTGGITTFSKYIQFHSFDNTEIGPLTIDSKSTSRPYVDVQTEAFYAIRFTGTVTIKENVDIDDSAFSYAIFNEDLTIDANSIGHAGFSPCNSSSTKPITLSIGNTEIGENAFEFFGKYDQPITLKFHSLDNNTRAIENYAFHEAKISGDLDVPFCFNRIGDYAFNNCTGILTTNIKFDEKSRDDYRLSIGERSFEGCDGLTYLSLKSNGGMTTIGYRAFYNVPIANELILPTSITQIQTQAFSCTSIQRLIITHDNAVIEFGSESFCNCTSLRGEIFIPFSTQYIGNGAFRGCNQISKLTLILEGNLRNIGSQAFLDCTNLAGSLDIPFKVEIIGNSAFANCTNLGEHLTFKYVRDTTAGDREIACSIGDYAFYRCTNLKKLVPITDSDCYVIRSIGHHAFESSGLTGDFTVPSSLRSIGSFAFRSCTLGRLILDYANSLEIIGEGAFQGSSVSGNIRMPLSLRLIDNNAFANCRNLGQLTFGFSGTPTTSQSLIIGSNAFSQSSIRDSLTIPSNTILILDNAFEGCNQLTSLSFNDEGSLNLIIGANVFKDCALREELELSTRLLNSIGITFKANDYLTNNFNNYAQYFSNFFDIDNYYYFDYGYEPAFSLSDELEFSVGERAFSNCGSVDHVYIYSGLFGKNVFENCRSVQNLTMSGGTLGEQNFIGCSNFNGVITLSRNAIIGQNAFSDFKEANFTLRFYPVSTTNNVRFNQRSFYNSSICGSLILYPNTAYVGTEAFAECKYLLGSLSVPISVVGRNSFVNSDFNGTLTVYQAANNNIEILGSYYDSIFKGATGFTRLYVYSYTIGTQSNNIPDYAYSGMPIDTSILTIGYDIETIGKYAFSGCNFYQIVFQRTTSFTVKDGAFSNCVNLNTTVDLRNWKLDKVIGYDKDGNEETIQEIPPRVFSGCRNLPSILTDDTPEVNRIGNEAFSRCSSLSFHLDFFLNPSLQSIGKRAFYGCSNLHGSLEIPSHLYRIEEYAFSECTGLSNSLTIHINPDLHAYIGPCAFKGCDGFKKGKLYISVEENEEDIYKDVANLPMAPFYKYDYFLIIGNEAFEDTKFKDIYYNGRFQPDCDFDIGFSHTKGIHTSSNFVNKSFCNYPLHSSKLSGGAIAGITIAVIVVVAAIVLLVLFLICRNKKNKDNSEDEVEMNADP